MEEHLVRDRRETRAKIKLAWVTLMMPYLVDMHVDRYVFGWVVDGYDSGWVHRIYRVVMGKRPKITAGITFERIPVLEVRREQCFLSMMSPFTY